VCTEQKTKEGATTEGYKHKQEKKEWFDEECGTVNEDKNRARPRAIQIKNKTRAARFTAMNEYR
jgi:hypothetical protein